MTMSFLSLVLFPALVTAFVGYYLSTHKQTWGIYAVVLMPVLFMYMLGSYQILWSIPLSLVVVLLRIFWTYKRS
ncbi:UNVERIFIED_CONTAM: hypothetical protein N8J90_00845 [Halobacillus marinus]|uniref:hypothetical protein n=1 Tax=Halobacillus sp. BAB-2008 TaxID=1246484 RepID=UPI00030E16B5|nr:hypothetical protein [Halobacillus sp. BAB-2008]